MPKSPAQQSIRIGSDTDPRLPNMADPAWAAWQARLDAGLIGTGSIQTPRQRCIHARNEMILCGYRLHAVLD